MIGKGLHLDQAPPLHLPLRFFLTAPLFGMATGGVLLWRGAELFLTPWAPATFALAHLMTLGFLTMVMVGALYQIMPVLVGARIYGVGLARLVHLGLTLGVVSLAGGWLWGHPWWLWVALPALVLAFVIALGQFAMALARAPSINVTVFSIGVAVASLTLVVVLGLLLGWGHASGQWVIGRPAFTVAHVYLAFGGWVGALITGVGYAVIPMFYLSTSFPKSRTRWVLASLLLLLVSGMVVSLWGASPLWHLLPLFFAALAVGVFAWTMWRLLRGRKRRVVDTTLRFWQVGIAAAPLSLVALTGYVVVGEARWLFLFGVLFLAGFASAVINGMLYKIVPFLVWLHRYSKLAGLVEVPLMRDIIPPGRMVWQWRVFLAGLALLLAAVLTGHDGLTRAAGAVLAGGWAILFFNLLSAVALSPDPDQMKPLDLRRNKDPHPAGPVERS